MNIKIVNEKDNKLLKRKEILLEVEYGNRATPSRQEFLDEFSKFFNVDKNLLEIDYIFSSAGKHVAKVKVKINYGKKAQ